MIFNILKIKNLQENRTLPSNITQNSDCNAYKPAIATTTEKVNGSNKSKGFILKINSVKK